VAFFPQFSRAQVNFKNSKSNLGRRGCELRTHIFGWLLTRWSKRGDTAEIDVGQSVGSSEQVPILHREWRFFAAAESRR
jgi:hypothetical protein